MKGELATTHGPGRQQIPGLPQRCIATKKNGMRCRNTPVPGTQVCEMHGGSIGHVAAAGRQRVIEYEAKQVLIKLGVPVTVEPKQALLDQVYIAYGMAQTLGALVQEVDADDLMSLKGKVRYRAQDLVELHAKWVDRAARIAAMALKVGIEERFVKLAEFQSVAIVAAIKEVIDALGLDDEVRARAYQFAATSLRRLADSDHPLQQVTGVPG